MTIAAVYPIRRTGNEFWSSQEGLSWIKKFLSSCRCIHGIDNFVVPTHEAEIALLAEELKMDVKNLAIPGTIDAPYSYAQSCSIAESFFSSTTSADEVIIADHRNLLLCPEDIERTVRRFQAGSKETVLNLTPCKDHPCQYRSFYQLLAVRS